MGVRGSDAAADPSRIREWAEDADSTFARAEGPPISVHKTVTDELGYDEANLEYDPENRSVTYVRYSSGGESVMFDTQSFERWGTIETAQVGTRRASLVTASRLGVGYINAGVAGPPASAETDEVVILVSVSKELDREGNVKNWPVATFPDLKEAAPRSIHVSLSLEGHLFSRAVPVFASYSISQEA